MTEAEAKAWKEFTASTKSTWTVDPIHDKRDDLLVHIGGVDGKYASVRKAQRDGFWVEVGSYAGAIPHIGEALLHREGTKWFPDADEALKFLVERGGVKMLTDLLTSSRGRVRRKRK